LIAVSSFFRAAFRCWITLGSPRMLGLRKLPASSMRG
jgi:hypothetical protein